jgi:hypothetical protein
MQKTYDDPNEQALHLGAIEALAEELKLSVDHVQALYETHYSQLKSQATVKDFLVLFASRRVREELQYRAH